MCMLGAILYPKFSLMYDTSRPGIGIICKCIKIDFLVATLIKYQEFDLS